MTSDRLNAFSDGVIAITHAHNAEQWTPSAGMPLPPDHYRALFEGLETRVFAESRLLDEAIAGHVDLSRCDSRAALRSAGHPDTIMQFPAGTRTAADAAAAVGCTVAQIAKSIVFRCGMRAAVVITSGANRVDQSRAEAAFSALAPARHNRNTRNGWPVLSGRR